MKFYVDPPEDEKVKIFEVASKSKEGVTYTMRIFPDGEIVCGCPWNAIKSLMCSHIKAFMNLKESVREMEAVEKKAAFAADFPF